MLLLGAILTDKFWDVNKDLEKIDWRTDNKPKEAGHRRENSRENKKEGEDKKNHSILEVGLLEVMEAIG